MEQILNSRQGILTKFADLLEYPTEDYHDACRMACATIRPWCSLTAAEELDQFIAAVTGAGIEQLEELHTRTFSLAPVCIPYVGVQLFGESNFKRGDLLAGLSREMQTHGIEQGLELADYLGNVLKLSAVLSPEDLDELLSWCLRISTQRMADQVANASTPYKHLISAINTYVSELHPEVLTRV